MRITLFTLFPHWFDGPLGESILGRAREGGLLDVRPVNPRDFATDAHQTVDAPPYGGGGGMVLRPDVLARALDQEIGPPGAPGRPPVIHLSPRGRPFRQADARRLARLPALALLCGHYEAIDQRLLDSRVDEEVSLGDFVLTGGEIPAMAVVDAVARMIPGVLGNAGSAATESFMEGLLEGPHFTRPEEFEGCAVPPVLLSGNHGAIARWREEEALAITRRRRPDLYARLLLHPEQTRRLARRGRPFAIWRLDGEGQARMLYATRKAREAAGSDEAIFRRRSEKGLSPDVRWVDIREAFGEDPARDREALRAELAPLEVERATGPAAVFLENLLREMRRLDS